MNRWLVVVAWEPRVTLRKRVLFEVPAVRPPPKRVTLSLPTVKSVMISMPSILFWNLKRS
jgi:hypothetical protein